LYSHQTQVRKLPDDIGIKLSIGDVREKVRSTLGSPLIDARNLGLEVYRKSGRDFDVGWVIAPWVPIPVIGDKVIVVVLVVYDTDDVVKDISTGIVERGTSYPYYSIFWLAASDYVFANSASMSPPDMLLAPAVSWEDIQGLPHRSNGRCELFLVMGDCPMERILLDDNVIADLSPAAVYCGNASTSTHSAFAAFIRKAIPAGKHRLKIHQKSWRGDFDTSFECESGETVYAEFQAHLVSDWWSQHFEGAITTSKGIPRNTLETYELRQILWYGGAWYGPVDSSLENR
jgi:hypothetical protein